MNTKFLRSWRNRSRLSRRQAMAQTPTAATRAEINSASLNHAYRAMAAVCTENLNPHIMVMKAAKDRVLCRTLHTLAR